MTIANATASGLDRASDKSRLWDRIITGILKYTPFKRAIVTVDGRLSRRRLRKLEASLSLCSPEGQRAVVYALMRRFVLDGDLPAHDNVRAVLRALSSDQCKIDPHTLLRSFLPENLKEELVVLRQDRSVFAYVVPPPVWQERLLAQKRLAKSETEHRAGYNAFGGTPAEDENAWVQGSSQHRSSMPRESFD